MILYQAIDIVLLLLRFCHLSHSCLRFSPWTPLRSMVRSICALKEGGDGGFDEEKILRRIMKGSVFTNFLRPAV